MERRILIHKHLKEGYCYKEAFDMVQRDCDSIRTLDKKNKVNGKKSFKDAFRELTSGAYREHLSKQS